MPSKEIHIYLDDEIPNGILTADIENWTGRVLVAPRARLKDLADFETQRIGIYILIGEDSTSKEVIYVGESDNVFNRLTQHVKDTSKDFWSRTIIVTSSADYLTKSHVRYLESRLIERVAKSQRAKPANGTAPDVPTLSRAAIASMEEFLNRLQSVLSVIGFSFMIPQPVPSINASQGSTIQDDKPVFLYAGSGFKAEAQLVNGQFVVLKGSLARKSYKDSLGKNYTRLREQSITDGKLAEDINGGSLIFTTDVEFSAPTPAACIISGTSVNGRDAWKHKKTGETYNQWDQRQLKQSGLGIEDEPE